MLNLFTNFCKTKNFHELKKKLLNKELKTVTQFQEQRKVGLLSKQFK